MRILWLSHLIPYPPKGGVLQRSYNLLKETSKYHEVSLLAFNQSMLMKSMFPSVAEGMAEAKGHLSQFCEKVEFLDIPSETSQYGKYILALKSLFSRDPYTINWLVSDKMTSAIAAMLQDDRFDAIHFDTISLASYASLFGENPKVLDHHNVESHMMLRRAEQEESWLKKLYYYQEGKRLLKYEQRVCPKFSLHITCSQLDTQRLKQIVPGLNVDEIPNGVDVEYFMPEPKNEIGNHLVFAGGLSWYPNKEAMIFFADKVWPILKKTCPELIMDVIGKNPSVELVDLASKDPNFCVHGFVDDVRDYLSKASVYVCPIRDGGGTKLKMLDAFAMGMAVVAHPVACEGIDVTEKENVIFSVSPEEFAENIVLIIKDKNLRKVLGENARKLVESKYAFSEIGRKLSLDFEKL